MKKCSKCKILKSISLFDKNKNRKDNLQCQCKQCRYEYRINNKEKIINSNKKYYENNTEKILTLNKKWAEKNREKSNIIKYNYYQNNKEKYNKKKKERYNNDKLFNLKERLKSRTSSIYKIKGYKKNSKTEVLLGISYSDMLIYLENKFIENMSWDNKSEWHIDHIIPLDSAKTEEELVKLCHYTNLQPLWATDNIKKSNKIL